MSSYSRWAARAAAVTDSQSSFRPFEKRIGLVGLAMMLPSARTHALRAHDFMAGSIAAIDATGGHGSLTGHGG